MWIFYSKYCLKKFSVRLSMFGISFPPLNNWFVSNKIFCDGERSELRNNRFFSASDRTRSLKVLQHYLRVLAEITNAVPLNVTLLLSHAQQWPEMNERTTNRDENIKRNVGTNYFCSLSLSSDCIQFKLLFLWFDAKTLSLIGWARGDVRGLPTSTSSSGLCSLRFSNRKNTL